MTDELIAQALEQWLTGHCPLSLVHQIDVAPERGGRVAQLWRALEDAGFADALRSEERGGAGLGVREAFPLLALCGAHALPLPLAPTMIARLLLEQAGIAVPAGSMTLGVGRLHAGQVQCDALPFGKVADWVLLCQMRDASADWRILPCDQAQQEDAIFCLDARMRWSMDQWNAATTVPLAYDPFRIQALVFAALLSGALNTVLSRTLQFANERQQFGRPIGKFQAIQHQLSVLAEHVVCARMAAQIACDGQALSSARPWPDVNRVAIGKARCSEAAVEVAALSHSIHGAIGFTEEFDLQLFTRRLHAWRLAGGAESWWHTEWGRAALDSPVMAVDFIRQNTFVR